MIDGEVESFLQWLSNSDFYDGVSVYGGGSARGSLSWLVAFRSISFAWAKCSRHSSSAFFRCSTVSPTSGR